MTAEPPSALRRDDALAMWHEYVSAHADGRPRDEGPTVERFGDSAALADELLDLVLAGTKRATAGLVSDFVTDGEPLPRIGGHWVVCDSSGRPRCVLRSVEQATRGDAWSDDLEVVFERFSVVWPPEVADPH